ncbi:MAG: Flp pilus assembly complex ATPase component TadA [Candidatus Omnitrophica bacterium]|nr:Flp pilus assembly complex ATPase component TadA [Candidatus Omnitrophota bacterium]
MVMRLGEMLIQKKLITSEQLKAALKEQQKIGEPIGETLIKMGYLTQEQLFPVLAEQLNLPFINLEDVAFDPEVIKRVPAKFAWYYKIIPLYYKDGKLTVATFDPLRSLNDAKMFLKDEVEPVLSTEKEITKALEKNYGVGAETIERIMDQAPKETVEEEEGQFEKVEDLERLAEDASVVKLVNQIILEAHQKRATDIHIEPYRGKMGLRYRIDGVLYEANVPSDMVRLFPSIISRIKIMSKLNIVERRLPQDGRAVVKVGKEEFDLRISVIPTRFGEGIVIRILPTKMLFDLGKLGLEQEELRILDGLIHQPHGIIFVTGPTGSGKTTTLYASLNKIKSTRNKIITIEDPIEYELDGITQIQVMPEIGFTFAQGLRSVLRHDPDIMMVGEVRDFETAELAIRIALTGHLIFSTLHTNDAAGGATRLLDIGIEPFLAASSINAFIAQRLVRVICPKCKTEDNSINPEVKKQIVEEIKQYYRFCKNPLAHMQKLAGIKESDIHFYRGEGCEECNKTGFRSRTAIYEMLLVNKRIKELMLAKSSSDKIREEAINQGMKTLRISGWGKVIDGITTPDEVMRVTQVEE